MDISSLAKACERGEFVTVTMGPPKSRGNTRRLFRTEGPRGEILDDTDAYRQVVQFKSKSVLKCLKRAGLIA